MICNKKKLSIKRKYPSVLHVSPNVEDGSPIHCINFKPTNRNSIRASRVFKFNLLRKWLLIAFCLEKPLSHCLALFPISLAIFNHRLNSRLQKSSFSNNGRGFTSSSRGVSTSRRGTPFLLDHRRLSRPTPRYSAPELAHVKQHTRSMECGAYGHWCQECPHLMSLSPKPMRDYHSTRVHFAEASPSLSFFSYDSSLK